MLRRWMALWMGTMLWSSRAESVLSTPRLGDAWSDPANPIVRIFAGQRLDLWSLKPLQHPAPPPSTAACRDSTHPIDRFLGARLANRDLALSSEADRRTLIRRVTFDLTGLPPTPEAVESFLQDPSPDAYEQRVERLLASPRYGEHQARLWLDVIRYSDSNGFDWDEFRPQAWRFRDYVIRTFNADKPFDRFVREQLAGDELFDQAPATEEERDALIATGYLRLGPQDNAAPLFNEQDRARTELMTDLVETTGSAFLAMTLSCCRCHDHKYDPLSQEDHYRLRAFFEPVKYGDDVALELAHEQVAIRARNAAIEKQIAALTAERTTLVKPFRDWLMEQRRRQLPAEERRLLEPSATQPSTAVPAAIQALRKKLEPEEKQVVAQLPVEKFLRWEALGREMETLTHQQRPFTKGLLMIDAAEPPKPTHVLAGGDHKQPRQPVPPGFLTALDPNPAIIAPVPNRKSSGRRTALAQWISSPAHPLTARVWVNRIWQQHFGHGLVASANDFGLAGVRPTHPELLDWLATDFLQNGGSTKALHRRIVTSAAYRQASTIHPQGAAADPENRLLWRQHPRRLAAEQLRDAVLQTAGTLQHIEGGPPIWPELPAEILQANPAFLDDNATRTKGWYPSPPDRQSVRSVFLVQKRTVRVPFMEAFDLPENATSCARRIESTVAPQALMLLNDPTATAAARDFAARIRRLAATPDAQIQTAFRLALQRPPAAAELDACRQLLQRRTLEELGRAILNLNEFVYLD